MTRFLFDTHTYKYTYSAQRLENHIIHMVFIFHIPCLLTHTSCVVFAPPHFAPPPVDTACTENRYPTAANPLVMALGILLPSTTMRGGGGSVFAERIYLEILPPPSHPPSLSRFQVCFLFLPQTPHLRTRRKDTFFSKVP